MSQRIFVLHSLRPGVEPADYETWLRTVNMPIARRLEPVERVTMTRVSGLLMGEGEPPYQYVETLDVTDLDAYLAVLGDPELAQQSEEFARYVDEFVALLGEDIEDDAPPPADA